jgi:CHASE1-domain containing sensor protein
MRKLPFKVWSLITAGVLLAGVFAWLLFADYLFPTIADNFTYRANILSYDNFFDEHKNDFSGDILSKTRFSYNVEKKENNVLTIHNIFDVRKPSGNPIFAVERLYGIDQISGEHINGYGDKNRNGYLFAPKNPGREFTYWHINYDVPALMKFRGKERVEGLLVYRYECDYKADQTKNLGYLPGVPQQQGVEMDINLKLWVEPTTGYLIKYEDHTTGWFYDIKTKKRTHPWNRFHNQFEETSISNQVQNAVLAKDFKIWQNQYFPFSNLFLILIILSIGYRSERKNAWRSYLATGLILFTGFTSSIFMYNFLKKIDAIRLETIFSRDCESIRISVQRELEQSVEVLNAVKSSYVSQKDITREQFRIAVKQCLINTENIKAIAWIPYIPSANRDAAEMKARKDGIPDFKFTELQNGHMKPAGKRDVYYPIYYIEPYELNKMALGYDFASNPERKTALEKAAATGESTVSKSIVLVQQLGEENNKSFLIMIPLYEDELGLSNAHTLHSYLSEGINIHELMQEAISRVSLSNNVAVTVIDLGTKNREILFSNIPKNNSYHFEKNSTLQVANGLWKLQFQSTPIINRLESSWFTIILPIIVALMTFILAIFVFSMLTDESKKLRSINMQLTNEIVERNKAEGKLNEHMHVLESQNIQLSDFCYIISHNLRGPLVNISMLVDYIENSEDELEKKEMFGKIKPVVNTINETFNELVESLQVKFDLEIESEKIIVKDSIEKMLATLEFEISSCKAGIKLEIGDTPVINFPKKYFDSILFNLISNSLKYKSPDRTPIIKIKTEKVNNSIILSVTDIGLGIDLKMHKHNLFKIRKVFHKHPDARGFGLFMTKTQIEAMGGKIWAESTPNVGSSFFVEFINQNT